MSRRAGALLLVLLALAGACGRKTAPRPPELVAPRPVGEVALSSRADGVEVAWTRPTRYVDGSTMPDLGGFAIERQSFSTDFHEVARVPVTDRGRFQQATRFTWVDREVRPTMTYHYRVVAFTTDGYYSAPSGAAAITWAPPAASPTPERTP
jgi:hypothetical protein